MTREPSPILIALGALTLACAMDAIIKHLGATYSALMIGFLRYAFGSLAAGAVFTLWRPPPITMAALRVHVLRALAIAVSAVSFFYSLSVLPLAEANVLAFVAPLYVPLLARVLLKERLGGLSVGAALIGFVGVVVAAHQPGGSAMTARHLSGILASLFGYGPAYALSLVLLRYRAAADGPVTIGVMGNVLPALLLAAPALALSPPPALADAPIFALVGALGASYWLMMSWAYARAPAQRIAPLDYTSLIWAALWGRLFFRETPPIQTWIGAAFIIGACLLVGWDERRSRAGAEIPVRVLPDESSY